MSGGRELPGRPAGRGSRPGDKTAWEAFSNLPRASRRPPSVEFPAALRLATRSGIPPQIGGRSQDARMPSPELEPARQALASTSGGDTGTRDRTGPHFGNADVIRDPSFASAASSPRAGAHPRQPFRGRRLVGARCRFWPLACSAAKAVDVTGLAWTPRSVARGLKTRRFVGWELARSVSRGRSTPVDMALVCGMFILILT